MKTLMLFLLLSISIVGSTENNNSNSNLTKSQQSALADIFSNQPGNQAKIAADQNGQIRFNPILLPNCDERDLCSFNFQCGWDGYCGSNPAGPTGRCICD